MTICGVTYFVVAAEKAFEQNPLNDYLDLATVVGIALTVAVTFFAMFPVIKMKLTGKMKGKKEPESFFSQVMISSLVRSFHINLFLLIILLGLESRIDKWSLPPSFYLVVMFGSMVFWVGMVFLFSINTDELDELED